jgi:lichenan operon transcriptional antiterminator
MLSKNQTDILSHLIDRGKEVSSRDIQRTCLLSRKTLTQEIRYINDVLRDRGVKITGAQGIGYSIKILDEEKYRIFLEEFLSVRQRSQYLNIEKNFLAYEIMIDLVLAGDYITVDDLAEKYYYSRGTVLKAVKTAKNYLGKFNCPLVSKPNYGMKIEASEWSKRLCILFLDRIATQMGIAVTGFDNPLRTVLDREKYNFNEIKLDLSNVLRKHKVNLPYSDFILICLYIIISGERSAFYEDLRFDRDCSACHSACQREFFLRLQDSVYYRIARDAAERFRVKNIIIRENDILAMTILFNGYASRESFKKCDDPLLETCKKDIDEFLEYAYKLYDGLNTLIDSIFLKEFVCFLVGMKNRILFNLPNVNESIHFAKKDGTFLLDICRDFGVFYEKKYKIKLPETELISMYFVFSSSQIRHNRGEKQYKVAVVSALGIHFARNIGERLINYLKDEISEIKAMEYTHSTADNLGGFDFIITDIEPKRYNFTSVPIIRLDFFRFPKKSQMLFNYLSMIMTMNLEDLIKDDCLIRNMGFKDKDGVFEYIAKNYVDKRYFRSFVAECTADNSLISNERRNRIAIVTVSPEYFSKKEILFFFNDSAFQWDQEEVQMIILFTRKNRKIWENKEINKILACLLESEINIAEKLSKMDAFSIIKLIAGHYYG